ncbi:MAG: hypothetical protein L3J91_01105 [Thermoplasmata archaeon]|nr:hypothetical protein [Thermoplasmata archaeon]
MHVRLHRGGRWRTWLGAQFGGGPELGDRIWRRILHFIGAAVLFYYLLPPEFFPVLSNEEVLLIALAAVLGMEALRLRAGLELPTIRPWEAHRVASYAYFAVALVVAVLVFPRAIAVGVVLGTAFIDPLIGEMRLRPGIGRRWLWGLPLVLFGLIVLASLLEVGRWSLGPALFAAAVAGAIAIAVERPKLPYYDDDMAMVLAPGLALALWVSLWPAFPGAF